ncbi:hypothetical protein SDC9_188203 [bioreactor metagenome]|uniref:Uncharacterized protein n=1 Tax=bioreactor metagenome TaxID=1076179 RepID=A0A645HNN3_9ZZZZ
MQCLPEAYKNIIVGLKWRGKFAWYVSLKDMWFLDETALEREYEQWCKRKGLPLNFAVSEDDERYGLCVLNEKNVNLFLPRIAKYAVSSDELREYMKLAMNIKSRDEVTLEYMPSLYIDFDKKILYSMYTEPASFEDYLPANWQGYYQDFLDFIEPIEQFWRENNKEIIDFRKGPDGK